MSTDVSLGTMPSAPPAAKSAGPITLTEKAAAKVKQIIAEEQAKGTCGCGSSFSM